MHHAPKPNHVGHYLLFLTGIMALASLIAQAIDKAP